MSNGMQIQLIAVVVAIACAIPGVFLVLRKMALMSDAISHAILPGIVIAFFISNKIDSPYMIVGAVVMGIFTVAFTEMLNKTKLVKEDAAMGIVFPFLFSVGVILVSLYAGNVHLDTDAVLLGEITLAPFDRFIYKGQDIGPRALYTMGLIMVINITVITLFFKELKLSAFDPGLAAAMGFFPVLIHYGLMILISITAVGAFDSVGSILVVALMIVPANTAALYTRKLSLLIILSVVFASFSAVSGYWVAIALDASIAGAIGVMNGVFFLFAFLFAPKQGMIAIHQMKQKQRWDFAVQMLTVHLLHHTGEENFRTECNRSHLTEHINWSSSFAEQVVERVIKQKLARENSGQLELTEEGKHFAHRVMVK